MPMETFQANDKVWFYGKDGKPINGVVYLVSTTNRMVCRILTDCALGNHYYEVDNQLLHAGVYEGE